MSASAAHLSDLDAFELELRKLSGVVAVGYAGGEDAPAVHVTVDDPDQRERVRVDADDLARLYLGRSIWLVVAAPGADDDELGRLGRAGYSTGQRADAGAAGGGVASDAGDAGGETMTADARADETARAIEAARAALAAREPTVADLVESTVVRPVAADAGRAEARGVQESDEARNDRAGRVELGAVRRVGGGAGIEVVLVSGRREAVGSAPTTSPSAVAGATIAALEGLGWRMQFSVAAAVRLGVGIPGAVAVVLSGAEGERLGIARSASAEDAAAKATLHALNRYLEDPRRVPGRR